MKENIYNNKNLEVRRISRQNFSRGEQTKPSCLYSAKNDTQEAMVKTVLGTLDLIKKRDDGTLKMTNEDIEKGIESNAQRLGMSVEDYHEKMDMITNPKPEENPESSSEIDTETSEPLS